MAVRDTLPKTFRAVEKGFHINHRILKVDKTYKIIESSHHPAAPACSALTMSHICAVLNRDGTCILRCQRCRLSDPESHTIN